MPRPKGHPKSGGRKVGSLNKRTEDLLQIMEESGYNPLKSLLAKYNDLPPEEQLKIDLKLMEYVYPKLKEQNLVSKDFDSDCSNENPEHQFNKMFEIINSNDPEIIKMFKSYNRTDFFEILANLSLIYNYSLIE